MPLIIQEELKRRGRSRKAGLRREVLFGDLGLLLSVTVARFIVWLTLRRRQQEQVARRKQLKLLQGDEHRSGQGAVRS